MNNELAIVSIVCVSVTGIVLGLAFLKNKITIVSEYNLKENDKNFNIKIYAEDDENKK
jgi:hypothetical protein